MENSTNSGSKVGAFLGGAGLVIFAVTVGLVWRPAREKLAGLLNPQSNPPATLAPSTDATGRKILYYQDPMHPWYKSDKPGLAPDCGMKLVPVYADEQQTAGPGPLPPRTVQISPARQQLMGVTTALTEYRPIEKTIRTAGQVAIDETLLSHVHVRVNGWIQKVFVDSTWQSVSKGDPLFTVYSPDLVATEQEYLLALRARTSLGSSPYQDVSTGIESLLEATRHRLTLWDLNEAQIGELERTGKAQQEITFYAPTSGYVMERTAYPNQYVTPEMELYKLVDLSRVWVLADVYEFEMPAVSLGQAATMTAESLPGQSFEGRVDFLNPDIKPDTRTGTVRIEFTNPELKFKPGMFVNVELHQSFGRQLTVPVDAVLDSGTRQLVFVDLGNGRFAPRDVQVGERSQDYVAVLSGLRAGERVVTRANFLIDSESNLRQSLEGMMNHDQPHH
jgi:RND family efflux transporter MFP subunit